MGSEQLITTSESDFWPKNYLDCIFLGSWCFKNNFDNQNSTHTFKILPYHFDQRRKLYEANLFCNSLVDDLLQIFSQIYKDLLNIENNQRYWKIVLGFWLNQFISVLYDRYLSLAFAIREYPKIETALLDKSSYITPTSSVDFFTLSVTDLFNLQIYSFIWEYLDGKISFTKDVDVRKTQHLKSNKSKIDKLATIDSFNRILSFLMTRSTIWTFRTGFPKDFYEKLSRSFGYQIVPTDLFIKSLENLSSQIEPDCNLRKNLKENLQKYRDQKKDPFYNLCIDAIPTFLPISLFEQYSFFKGMVNTLKSNNLKALLSSNGFLVDSWNILVGEKIKSGVKLINVQHGGGYGISHFNSFENFEISISDYFITWGWKINGNNNIIPLSSPTLTDNMKGDRKSGKQGILVIANDYPRYFYRMHSYPVGNYIDKYRDWLEQFIDALGEDLLKHTLLRLYSIDYDGSRHNRIKKRFPNLTTNQGTKSFDKQIIECSLAVSDTNQTTFLQTLSLNIPTVVFWDKECHEIRKDARNYIVPLYESGILHDSPVSAANMIRNIYGNIDAWWFSVKTQQARIGFIERFAYRSKNKNKEWKNFFNRILY